MVEDDWTMCTDFIFNRQVINHCSKLAITGNEIVMVKNHFHFVYANYNQTCNLPFTILLLIIHYTYLYRKQYMKYLGYTYINSELALHVAVHDVSLYKKEAHRAVTSTSITV